MSLTHRQRQVLDFVRAYTDSHPYGPTVREVAAGIGITSTGSVNGAVDVLRALGLLVSEDHKARTLRPVRDARKACPVCLGTGEDPNQLAAS